MKFHRRSQDWALVGVAALSANGGPPAIALTNMADRPIRAGDVLTATISVESVRQAAGTALVATRSVIRTVDGEPVCTAYATLAHRAPDGENS